MRQFFYNSPGHGGCTRAVCALSSVCQKRAQKQGLRCKDSRRITCRCTGLTTGILVQSYSLPTNGAMLPCTLEHVVFSDSGEYTSMRTAWYGRRRAGSVGVQASKVYSLAISVLVAHLLSQIDQCSTLHEILRMPIPSAMSTARQRRSGCALG